MHYIARTSSRKKGRRKPSENIKKSAPRFANDEKELEKKFKNLINVINEKQKRIVAFSGGVDSSLLAYLCGRTAGETLCVINDSPIMSRGEIKSAVQFCRQFRLKIKIMKIDMLKDPLFRRNDRNRCYYCKRIFFGELVKLKDRLGYDVIFDGANYDDLVDYRPGRIAAAELGVRSPFIECQVIKDEIRNLSRRLKLPSWNLPSQACLASRIPYGTEITPNKVSEVEQAENIIRDLGYNVFRARTHGEILRLELGADENLNIKRLQSAIPKLKRIGFKYIVLDLEGYRSGNLNE